jgi:hypothetical protein
MIGSGHDLQMVPTNIKDIQQIAREVDIKIQEIFLRMLQG